MTAESNLGRTIHLEPTASLAERVLLPGDPGRALLLAQTLLDAPAMFNHRRGLWGYTGVASDGQPLTIQSTGMGGPSAAIVIAELAELGAKRMIRVGTCGALDSAFAVGELLIATEVLPDDGASQALGASAPLAPDARLLAALQRAAGDEIRFGRIVSTDLFYDTPRATGRRWVDDGAIAVEMTTAAVFALASQYELQAAAILLITGILATRARIDPEALRIGEVKLGQLALAALT